MKYLFITEIAERQVITRTAYKFYGIESRIPGVIRIGRTWVIPNGEPKPTEDQIKSRKHIKTFTENER